ncbi:MAG: response regulator [Candidatus Hinthialibacter antarcticus]|nr:response regulator [Candidatus Hinthialibacter antarcticus]
MMNALASEKDNDREVIRKLLRGKNVLIVDDDTDYAEALDEVFSMQGCYVTRSCDPVSAMGCALTSNFDLMIVDKNMPGIDGIEFAEKIHEVKPSSKIVMITAYPNEETRKKSLEAGIRFFLSKPFRKNDLLDVVSFLFLQNPKNGTTITA